jgi:hypothetical protein
MNIPLNNTHAIRRSANLEPGSTFESVGVFFMNIYKPKPLPSDIVNRCLEELSCIIGQLEIKQITHAIDLPVYQHQKSKLSMQVLYYRECKRLFEKGQTNGN